MIYKMFLDSPIVPKVRPQVNTQNKVAFLSENYINSQIKIINSLGSQWEFLVSNRKALRVSLWINVPEKHLGDADNIAGSILDALVKAEIIPDDRLKFLPRLTLKSRKDLKNIEVILRVHQWDALNIHPDNSSSTTDYLAGFPNVL